MEATAQLGGCLSIREMNNNTTIELIKGNARPTVILGIKQFNRHK